MEWTNNCTPFQNNNYTLFYGTISLNSMYIIIQINMHFTYRIHENTNKRLKHTSFAKKMN